MRPIATGDVWTLAIRTESLLRLTLTGWRWYTCTEICWRSTCNVCSN